MNTLARRFAIVLGVSILASLLFVPLGSTQRAETHRQERAAQLAARQKEGGPKRPPREPPSALVRIAGPLLKQTVLMGLPAGFVVLLGFGVRRLRR